MSGRSTGGGAHLERLRQRSERWRAENGGPGIPWPEDLWAEAVEAARVAGVPAVARSLRVDRGRLAARLARAGAGARPRPDATDGQAFVEVDARRLCAPSRTVVRFAGGDGERLELELGDGAAVDLIGLARAFWSRGG